MQEPSSDDSLPATEPLNVGVRDTLPQDENQLEAARLLSSGEAQPPTVVSGFQIIKRLGEGAYGSVWLAREQNTGKAVAIKFYTHRRGLDWSFLSREVEKLAVLYTSRHIVGLLDVGWSSDPPYYIMEYLENGSLETILAAGPLPVAEAVRIARSVLGALVHAHGSGILHCDLKPANVLLDADFEPRLCDFGQSRLSNEQNPALGTLFYMAPEQASLDAIPDARWDVYALGALLYHMLTGHPPYRSESSERLIRSTDNLNTRLKTYRRILRDSPRPQAHRRVSGVDKRLAEIVDRCLRIDSEKRFPNAQAVLDVLELRERQRSRRPLIALGIVGPAMLMILMGILVGNVMHNAVTSARTSLTARALESNALPARILARSLQQELETRQRELQGIAADPALRDLIQRLATAPIEERMPLIQSLDEIKYAAQSHLTPDDRDTSWFLTDAEGFQRWRHPRSELTMDRRFSYRDYFHGQHEDLPERDIDRRPIRGPHISIAFRSEANGLYMVAISVPVLSPDGTQTVGVLGRTQELGLLQDQYERFIRSPTDHEQRVIAVVDRRSGWRLIDHPWMTRDNLENKEEAIDRLRLEPSTRRMLESVYGTPEKPKASYIDVRLDEYEDPVASISADTKREFGAKWLAAFCPIGETGWLALIQEPREQAWAPVDAMRRELIRYAIWALVICAALIGLLWFFVLRALSDRSFRMGTGSERMSKDTFSNSPTSLSDKN